MHGRAHSQRTDQGLEEHIPDPDPEAGQPQDQHHVEDARYPVADHVGDGGAQDVYLRHGQKDIVGDYLQYAACQQAPHGPALPPHALQGSRHGLDQGDEDDAEGRHPHDAGGDSQGFGLDAAEKHLDDGAAQYEQAHSAGHADGHGELEAEAREMVHPLPVPSGPSAGDGGHDGHGEGRGQGGGQIDQGTDVGGKGHVPLVDGGLVHIPAHAGEDHLHVQHAGDGDDGRAKGDGDGDPKELGDHGPVVRRGAAGVDRHVQPPIPDAEGHDHQKSYEFRHGDAQEQPRRAVFRPPGYPASGQHEPYYAFDHLLRQLG